MFYSSSRGEPYRFVQQMGIICDGLSNPLPRTCYRVLSGSFLLLIFPTTFPTPATTFYQPDFLPRAALRLSAVLLEKM